MAPERICVTGNTVIDALLMVGSRSAADCDLRASLAASLAADRPRLCRLFSSPGTGARASASGFENICRAIAELFAAPDVRIVYPVHLNPNVHEPVRRIFRPAPTSR